MDAIYVDIFLRFCLQLPSSSMYIFVIRSLVTTRYHYGDWGLMFYSNGIKHNVHFMQLFTVSSKYATCYEMLAHGKAGRGITAFLQEKRPFSRIITSNLSTRLKFNVNPSSNHFIANNAAESILRQIKRGTFCTKKPVFFVQTDSMI
jgi:hypothetical protein